MLSELTGHSDSIKKYFIDTNGITCLAIKQVSVKFPNLTLEFTSRIGIYYYLSAITVMFKKNRISILHNIDNSIPKYKISKKLLLSFSRIIDIFLQDILPTFSPALYLRYTFLPVRYPSYYKEENSRAK